MDTLCNGNTSTVLTILPIRNRNKTAGVWIHYAMGIPLRYTVLTILPRRNRNKSDGEWIHYAMGILLLY